MVNDQQQASALAALPVSRPYQCRSQDRSVSQIERPMEAQLGSAQRGLGLIFAQVVEIDFVDATGLFQGLAVEGAPAVGLVLEA